MQSKQHPVLVVRDSRFEAHLEKMPHLESYRRIQAAVSVLEDPTLDGKWTAIPPRMASEKELAMVHTPEHIARIAASSGRPYTSFDMDTQATARSYEAARLAAGAVFSLIDSTWEGPSRRGFAFVRPPGHHAESGRSMGFCLFNNIALGARYLQTRYGAKRLMIVDIDAHHGNGTQSAFYGTDSVLYASFHQFPAYPGTGNIGEVGVGEGAGYTVNIPLGKGCGDKDFAQIIHFLIAPLAQAYKPEMLLVSCGFDLYFRDRLCGMRATGSGYAMMTCLLLDIADRLCDGRILFVMEGGYSLKGIKECGLRVMQELCGIPTLSRTQLDPIIGSDGPKLSALKKALEVQRDYWKNLILTIPTLVASQVTPGLFSRNRCFD